MFQVQKTQCNQGRSYKFTLHQKGNHISYAEFLTLLGQDDEFRTFFIEVLSDVPFRAYHWETPPVTRSTTGQPFEFAVTRSPGIDLPPDPGPFTQYFRDNDEVAVFNNLGNDAKLVAPTPPRADLNYSHIGVFTDQAPAEQQQKLWQRVGLVTKKQLSNHPLWLNTAGGGVAWLHIRLDSRPKYYRHQPYCNR